VRCVDWCDAHAYCQSVGKRLCGANSAAAPGMPYDAPVAALDNQWYSACSHGGEVVYPYGDAYNATACWGADRPPTGAPTVKSAPGCVGGYQGLWDMSGGLAEWVDSCNAEKGMGDACHIRGGSFSGTAEQLRCDWQSGTPRNTTSNYIGFRCCAAALP
jgi:formylglycine-generating enzyme required for sulfatase activity